MKTYAAPGLTYDQLPDNSFETCLDLYQRRIRGWYLDQARILQESSPDAGFVVLLVAMCQIESSKMYRRGKLSTASTTKEFFRCGFRRIFPVDPAEAHSKLTDEHINDIYHQVRNGLFHAGHTRGKVLLTREHDPHAVYLGLDKKTGELLLIALHPSRCLDAVEKDLSRYVMHLRSASKDDQLRENFTKTWNLMGKK